MHDLLSAAADQAFATVPDRPFLDQLMHIFGHFFRLYAELPGPAPRPLCAICRGPVQNAARVNEMTFGFLGRLAHLIQAAQNRGELAADLYPVQAAHNFFALYYMVLMGWLSGFVSLQDALDPGLRSAAALQIRGMLPR